MTHVWMRYAYGWEGIEEIEGVFATLELAMGEWRTGWQQKSDDYYVLQGSSEGNGDAIQRFTVQEE